MAWDRILGDIKYSLTGLEMMKINTANSTGYNVGDSFDSRRLHQLEKEKPLRMKGFSFRRRSESYFPVFLFFKERFGQGNLDRHGQQETRI
jgi:hypothetical protein